MRVENTESESIIAGRFKRMRSRGSNDTNTYNLYICLFTGIFLDNCGSLTKIRTESQLKSEKKTKNPSPVDTCTQLYKVQHVKGDVEKSDRPVMRFWFVDIFVSKVIKEKQKN